MKNWPYSLAVVTTSLWVGGMWAIGYLAVPVLFHALPDNRMLAGELAGGIFRAMSYAGMVCALFLLAYEAWRSGGKVLGSGVFWVIAAMLLLVLFGHFGLQPEMARLKVQALPLEVMHSEFSSRFRMLHGVASVAYLLQSLLGIVMLLKLHALRPAT